MMRATRRHVLRSLALLGAAGALLPLGVGAQPDGDGSFGPAVWMRIPSIDVDAHISEVSVLGGYYELCVSGFVAPLADPFDVREHGPCVAAPIRVTDYAPGWDEDRVEELCAYWARWHLNGMRPFCAHMARPDTGTTCGRLPHPAATAPRTSQAPAATRPRRERKAIAGTPRKPTPRAARDYRNRASKAPTEMPN